jgi:WD repeat and SOF domain-containing protein 1
VPFDPARNWPDLGKRFIKVERAGRALAAQPETPAAAAAYPTSGVSTSEAPSTDPTKVSGQTEEWADVIKDDVRDLSWATALKRTFEAYIRGERPNMYGEYIVWS